MTTVVAALVAGSVPLDLQIEREELGPDTVLRSFVYTGDRNALLAACAAADGILVSYVPFTADVIAQLDRCQVLSVCATGYEGIDIASARAAGISVCAVDEYCTDEVADHTLSLILALTRRLLEYHHQVQDGGLWRYDTLTGLKRLRGQTLGIVGLGRIGRAVASRAAGFGMQVIACDPYANAPDALQNNITLTDLDTLLSASDVISLHCNLTTENERFLNAAAFRKMKRRPLLINVARGGLIDEPDLVAALDNGLIAAAGLDVLASESPDLAASRLRGRDNVILTPHVAFYSDDSIRENRQISARNIRHHFAGNHSAVRKYVYQARSD